MVDIQEKAAFLLNKRQIVAALEANILYRIKEIEEKNGTVTGEVTVNDGWCDGDKRDELNRLRMLLLKSQEDKTQVETGLLKCQEEKTQLEIEKRWFVLLLSSKSKGPCTAVFAIRNVLAT